MENRGEGENMENNEMDELVNAVRNAAYALHVYLGNGLLEKVYENGLKHRLEKMGHKVEAQKNLKVYDEDGFLLGDYFADLLVDGKLIIELKAVKAIAAEHLAQTLNYLKITKMPLAIIINFGSYRFETRIVHPLCNGATVESEEMGMAVENMEKRGEVGCRPAAQEG